MTRGRAIAAELQAPPQPPDRALREAFTRETKVGVVLAIGVRLVVSTAGFVSNSWRTLAASAHLPRYLSGMLPALALIFLLNLFLVGILVLIARSKRPLLWCAVVLVLDLGLSSEFKFYWLWRVAGLPAHYPIYGSVRYGDIADFVVILCLYSLPLSRMLVLGAGLGSLAIWIVGIIASFVSYGAGKLYWGPFGPGIDLADLRAIQDVETLVPDYFVLQVVLFAVMAFLLAAAIQRGRSFVIARVHAEHELAFLSRFFSPAVAARIARDHGGRIAPARRQVAVLFVGTVDDPARPNLERIRAFYTTVEAAAFAHDGVVDSFSGGPVMVSFGAVETDETAVPRALACARQIAGALKGASCALHAGTAVCGELGGARARTFSVVGDVVNTTARVLGVAKLAGAALVATDDAIAALPSGDRPGGVTTLSATALRGRAAPVRLWSLPV